MKSRLLATAFLSSVLVFASTIGLAGSGYSTGVIDSVTSTTIHVTGPSMLRGSIANVQLDSDGNPEWIQSGIWVLRLRPGASDSDLLSAQLVVRMAMVMADGTAAHSHPYQISR